MKNETSTQHTPAPWTIRYGSGIDYSIHAEDYGRIVEGNFPNSTQEAINEHESVWFANARLIASAPELLDALRWTMIFVTNLRYDEQKEKKLEILKLIAKAEGKNLVVS